MKNIQVKDDLRLYIRRDAEVNNCNNDISVYMIVVDVN